MLKLRDVTGDGHCFYRSLYHLVKSDETVFRGLLKNVADEDKGYKYLRALLSSAFDRQKAEGLPNMLGRDAWEKTREMLSNLKMIMDGCASRKDLHMLVRMYPLVSCIRDAYMKTKDNEDEEDEEDEEVFDIVMSLCGQRIRHHATFASEIEVELVKYLLAKYDIRLLILSKPYDDDEADALQCKWMRDLKAQLNAPLFERGMSRTQKEKCRINVMVNDMNIHYQYLSFIINDNEETLIPFLALKSMIEAQEL